MGTKAGGENRLLQVQDLMERWGVSEDVVRRHVRDDGLPHLTVGRSTGRRPQVRFRLADVEAWEASRVQVREGRPAESAAPKAPAGLPPGGWDGKVRLGNRGKKAPAGSRPAGKPA